MPAHSLPPNPISRKGFWCLVRHRPRRYATVERRAIVVISTGIRVPEDPHAITARKKVIELDHRLQRYWQDVLTGSNPEAARLALDAAVKCREVNLAPITTTDRLDVFEAWSRFVALTRAIPIDRVLALSDDVLKVAGTAVLGTTSPSTTAPAISAPASTLLVSEMITEYSRINATVLNKKSPGQLKRWTVQRESVLKIFIETIGGDRVVTDLRVEHTHKFRAYWQKRALAGEIRINSANRQMRRVAGLFGSIKSFHQLDMKNPFAGLNIPGGRDGKRLAYAASFVQERFLAEGALDALNNEARRVIYLIVETGVRLSEACGLTEKAIHLDGLIPYIEVLDDDRETKTPGSVRFIPLVGVALMAMRAQPKGFPRYLDKADTLSATVNAFLTDNGLRPHGKKQTLYSLRHTIIDRLKAVEAPKDIQEDMLGHVHQYGEGTTLEHRHQWLEKIAFKPPSRV